MEEGDRNIRPATFHVNRFLYVNKESRWDSSFPINNECDELQMAASTRIGCTLIFKGGDEATCRESQ